MNIKPAARSLTILLIVLSIGAGLVSARSYAQDRDKIKAQIFREVNQLIKQAESEQAPLLAPDNYSRGQEYHRKALARYKKGDKLKYIQKDLDKAGEYFQKSIEAARISKVALGDLLEIRTIITDRQLDKRAPAKFSEAEKQFSRVVRDAERGDLRSARSKSNKAEKLYRKTVLAAYKEGVLKQTRKTLERRKRKFSRKEYKKFSRSINDIKEWIDGHENKEFAVAGFVMEAATRIDAVVGILYPEFYRNLPDTLLLGDFVLKVVSYDDKGHYDFKDEVAVGVRGKANVYFDCGYHILVPVFPGVLQLLEQAFVIVETVDDPENELSMAEARRIDPSAVLGQKMTLPLRVRALNRAAILEAKIDYLGKISSLPGYGGIRVAFEDATIEPISVPTTGRIIDGRAVYPTDPPYPDVPAKLYVAGFTVMMDSLVITPSGATAWAQVALPKSIIDGKGCSPAVLDIGEVTITADCQLYKDMPGSGFGPFIIDKTGMVFEGEGYTVDLSETQSPPILGISAGWRGVVLKQGATITEGSGAVISNTGYLKADYSFSNAMVTAPGIKARFNLKDSYAFSCVIPYGYTIEFQSGYVDVDSSSVHGGRLGNGTIQLPAIAASAPGGPGKALEATFADLTIQDDMDLAGTVELTDRIHWGELTKPGQEFVAFVAEPDKSKPNYAWFYLSGNPAERFVPGTAADFASIEWYGDIPAKLEEKQAAGVTITYISYLEIHTSDIPGSPPKQLTFKHGSAFSLSHSWLNIETLGINGEINIRPMDPFEQELGDPTAPYYKGGVPFDATLECIGQKEELCFMMQFASSAVHDSEFNGLIYLDGPSDAKIPFKDLELTSTASIVGGEIDLSDGPVILDYWGVELAEVSPGVPAGVLSVKTGQIILTQAGIKETRHFDKAFKLIWGEMLADGNLGELFFDYNSANQKFDGFLFTPHYVSLSRYDPSVAGYLQVCGDNHFNFFGSNYFNIHDEKYTGSDPLGVHGGRNIEIMKHGGEECETSDFKLLKNWGSGTSAFDFDIVYDENDQDGFLGEGSVDLPEHFQTILTASIQIDRSYAAIGLSVSTGTNFILNAVDMGSSTELWGCITIDGNTLSCMTLGFTLESTAQSSFGILGGAGGMIEAKLVIKPTVTTFAAAGMMYLDLSLGGNVRINGSILLIADSDEMSIYGDFQGEFEFSSLVAGLEANGHVNWYLSPTTQYLQGRAGISVYGRSLGSGGVSGGIFIGNNVPRSEVWVLTDTSNKYAVNMSSLPDHITGVYGFGYVDFSMNFGVFSGGIEIYAGLGAFVNMPGSSVTEVVGLPLPYVLANFGVSLHGEILWGVVSASAWVDLQLYLGDPFYFQGTAGLEGCVLWVMCASVDITIRLDEDGFDIY